MKYMVLYNSKWKNILETRKLLQQFLKLFEFFLSVGELTIL